MIKISKELLSEVLGETRVILDYEVSIDNTEIHWGHKDISEDGFISIYELAHKNLKEWALKHIIDKEIQSSGCAISSWTTSTGRGKARILVLDKSFIADTEVEAVVKACEYILEELKK